MTSLRALSRSLSAIASLTLFGCTGAAAPLADAGSAPVVDAEPRDPPPVVKDPAPAAPAAGPTWEGLLSSDDGPIANATVKAALFVQPQCVTTPCNAMNAGEMSLRTDAGGVVRVPLDGSTEGNRIAMADPDYAMLTIEGFEVQRVHLGPTAAPVPIRLRKR